ncbi:DnaJ sub C member 10 [Trifolium repens]|nr:DnaJ sub C member 10 [Trifolium repens]
MWMQVYNIFTTFAFKKFQEEFERATQYKICEENHVEFPVKCYKEQHSQKHKVLWDGDVVSCSCKHFEFCGILCPKKESYVQPTITKKRKDEDQAQ